MRAHKWIIITAIFAFGGFISLFQINSAWADAHHFNGVKGWLGIGILLLLIAAYCLYKTAKAGGGGNSTGAGAR